MCRWHCGHVTQRHTRGSARDHGHQSDGGRCHGGGRDGHGRDGRDGHGACVHRASDHDRDLHGNVRGLNIRTYDILISSRAAKTNKKMFKEEQN